jgi:hypothetical protein
LLSSQATRATPEFALKTNNKRTTEETMKTSRIIPLTKPVVLAALLLALACTSTPAVMLKGSGDPAFNTTAPTGALQDSGWQYQGQWGSFLGTPIGEQYFIAAKHVGGSVGAAFIFNDATYTTTAYWDDPSGSDLRIWKVDGLFPTWAPVYSLNDEVGKPLVVLGRGTQRGEPVIISVVETNATTNFVQSSYTTSVTNYVVQPVYTTNLVQTNYTTSVTNLVLKTNYTTTVLSLRRLGLTAKQAQKLYPTATIKGDTLTYPKSTVTTNKVVVSSQVVTNVPIVSITWVTTENVVNTQVVDLLPVVTSEVVTNLELKGWKAGASDGVMRWGENVVAGAGAYLVAAFDFAESDHEATLSSGDSSGAVFIQEGGVWKLAGINYGIEGPFRVTAADSSFYGAIFDKSGLCQQPLVDGILRPACFYATRLSTRLSWITTILSQ